MLWTQVGDSPTPCKRQTSNQAALFNQILPSQNLCTVLVHGRKHFSCMPTRRTINTVFQHALSSTNKQKPTLRAGGCDAVTCKITYRSRTAAAAAGGEVGEQGDESRWHVGRRTGNASELLMRAVAHRERENLLILCGGCSTAWRLTRPRCVRVQSAYATVSRSLARAFHLYAVIHRK